MHIDLRQLRHLLALAEHRSFVAAAGSVRLSQSAFSRSIQALEHSVGCQLVDRASKDLTPTRQGLVVLEHARRLVSGAHQLSNEIRQFNDLETGELRFGHAPASGLVTRAVAGFVGRYPKARVCVQTAELGKHLLADKLEFFVADSRGFDGDSAFQVLRLKPRAWQFFVRHGHPLAEQARITQEDLKAWPLAISAGEPSLVELGATIECAEGLQALVAGSDAIGVSHDGGGLVRLQVSGVEVPEARYAIVSRARQRLSPLAEAMVGEILLVDQAEDGASLERMAV
ncbi:LysR family transcriptional regulator [Pseudomonas japonica]|uniref:DNA-binding transcriptional regulator, LysR family n=1 Tax=Pseudomonas japonica TaxID=256466 RepID=A0A239B541_9PSED|nr:LysR family transcriptional regulator [Pseudomonas japonica]SNS02338.1 DNA-binding transcriptional regulator, LysR family [Pseudomonas japonica]